MFNIHPTQIYLILTEIKSFQEKVDKYPLITSKQDTPYMLSNPAYQKILAFINNLSPVDKATLVALMHLGHGDYRKNEWETAFNIAHEQLTRHIGEYLLCQPAVCNDIENGLKILGIAKKLH